MAFYRLASDTDGVEFVVPSGGARVLAVQNTPTLTINGVTHSFAADYVFSPKDVLVFTGLSGVVHLETV